MAATDPLSLAYNALWDMLESHSGFTSLVKPGNRIKYAGWMHVPLKDILSQADLPEVAVVPTGSLYGVQQSSNGTRLIESYEVILVAPERLGEEGGFLPVKWEIFRAFAGWHSLQALEWSGKPFVIVIKTGDATDTGTDAMRTLERGIVGWVSFIRFSLEMWFRTEDL